MTNSEFVCSIVQLFSQRGCRMAEARRRPAVPGPPPAQGLYDPSHEHDACGVGFVVDLKNRKSHDIVRKAVQILVNLAHRGACGCEANTGDGAGILVQTPDAFLRQECDKLGIKLPPPGEYGAWSVLATSNGAAIRTIRTAIFVVRA